MQKFLNFEDYLINIERIDAVNLERGKYPCITIMMKDRNAHISCEYNSIETAQKVFEKIKSILCN